MEVTIDAIADFFSTFGKVLYVKKRIAVDRETAEKRFKGSVVLEFESKEGVDKAIAASLFGKSSSS